MPTKDRAAKTAAKKTAGDLAARLRKMYGKHAVKRVRARLVKVKRDKDAPPPFEKYRNDPVGFIRDVLGVALTPDQEAIARLCPGRVKVNSGHGLGKAENVKTVIDTPDGRRYFGDLRPGDRVFGADGFPTEVTAVHPQGVIPQYRVTFDDGSYVLCSGEHLWNVQGRAQRRAGSPQKGRWLTLTTEEILRRGLSRKNGIRQTLLWTIPRQGAAQYAPRPVPVGPYTMGYWLGNGTVGTGHVTRGDDPEVSEWLRAESAGEVREYPDPDSAAVKVSVLGLKVCLEAAGVLGTPTDQKRVPDDYRENSPEARLAVLQGLMDADGTVGKSGTSTFTSTSIGLVRDVMWLVRSLGGRASLHPSAKEPWTPNPDGTRKYHKLAYTCTVHLDTYPLFRLRRKLDRIPPRERTPSRFIKSIEPEGTAEMMCISVAAPDGLYQTRGFVVTHNTFLCACLCLWWFYTRNPCVVITTAPTKKAVEDLLWTEVRLLRKRAKVALPDFFIGPRAPEMFDHDEHWAKGYTSSSGEAYQGRHRPSMLFIFDECEAVEPVYWTTTGTMYQPDGDHCWLAIGNPTTTASQSYIEDMATGPDGSPKWKVFSLSCLNHPNVAQQLRGESPGIPDAVTLGQIDQYVRDWASPIALAERKQHDFEWPPGSGVWYRPGPLFLGRVLGIRPVDGVDTVWGAEAWERAVSPKFSPAECWSAMHGITIGCDPASYGDDMTAIHVRTGPLSLHHESHNGWAYDRTATRIKDLCREWAAWYNSVAVNADRPKLAPEDVRVAVELDGPGLGVLSHGASAAWPNWRGVSVASASDVLDPTGRAAYWNRRSEIWVEAAKTAVKGGIDLSRLPKDVLELLRRQLTTVSYWIDGGGKTVVEPKPDIKARLGRSPDDADSFLVCHAEVKSWMPEWTGEEPEYA